MAGRAGVWNDAVRAFQSESHPRRGWPFDEVQTYPQEVQRLLVLVVAFSFLAAGGRRSHGTASRAEDFKRCSANLEKIHDLIMANDHHSAGLVATDLQTVYLMSRKTSLLRCPSDKHPETDQATQLLTSYEFIDLHGVRASAPLAQRAALVFEKHANHDGTRLVLFGDGAVRRFTDGEFDLLRKRGFVRD